MQAAIYYEHRHRKQKHNDGNGSTSWQFHCKCSSNVGNDTEAELLETNIMYPRLPWIYNTKHNSM